jgi:hypothetical protein
MKNVIKLEEFAMFAISIYGLYFFHQPWWVYLLVLLAPDISMLGYLGGNTIGAFSYNLFHHKGIAILLFGLGIFFNSQILLIIGIILFGHSSLDRMLGYGLKYKEGFGFTHLGRIGKEK